MPIPSDTSPDAEAVQLQLIRQKDPSELLAMTFRLSSNLAASSKEAIRRAHPEFSELQVNHFFIELHYGVQLADEVRVFQAKRPGEFGG